MKWFVLKNRRHLGPYSLSELKDLLRSSQIDLKALVLSAENEKLQNLSYISLDSILDQNVPSSLSDFSENFSFDNGRELENSEGAFDKEELSRVFEEKVDPLDLVGLGSDKADEMPRYSGRVLGTASDHEGLSFFKKINFASYLRMTLALVVAVFSFIWIKGQISQSSLLSKPPVTLNREPAMGAAPAVVLKNRAPENVIVKKSTNLDLRVPEAEPPPALQETPIASESESFNRVPSLEPVPTPQFEEGDVENRQLASDSEEDSLEGPKKKKKKRKAAAEQFNDEEYAGEEDLEGTEEGEESDSLDQGY